MPAAACVGDMAKHDGPHCHAPIHPAAPVPTPVPHPAVPLALMPGANSTVLAGGKPVATVTGQTMPCMLPSCVPGGPGLIAMGSSSVIIGAMPAARVGDLVAFASCVAPIPSPTGKILPPGCPTVLIN